MFAGILIIIFAFFVLPGSEKEKAKVGAVRKKASPVRKVEKWRIPATSYIDSNGHIVDKIDYPFVNDPAVIGTWKSVDFVSELKQFKPGKKQWKGGELYFKELVILPNGKTAKPWNTWTKGLIFHSGDKTASRYILKKMGDSIYMFFEWKSGDYTIRHTKPRYYVLKKTSGKKRSSVESRGRFLKNESPVGSWKSVDFVGRIEDFNPGRKSWTGRDFAFKDLTFYKDGKTSSFLFRWGTGYLWYTRFQRKGNYWIKEINGSKYLFMEWITGDVTIRGQKPSYYVLKKR